MQFSVRGLHFFFLQMACGMVMCQGVKNFWYNKDRNKGNTKPQQKTKEGENMKESYKSATITRVRVIHEVNDLTKKITKVIVILNTAEREFIHITDTSKMTWLEAECTARRLAENALALYRSSKSA